MQHQLRAGDFNDLAANYDRFRIGYSSELFDALAGFGFTRGIHVLDAGCGTGLSAEPLVSRGMSVTGIDPSPAMLAAAKLRVPAATFVEGNVENLPFAERQFDAAVCAQAFHWFDAPAAFAQLLRVVRPGGPIAVWWKMLGSDDAMRTVRATAAAAAGVGVTRDPLTGGFGAFYAAPFATRTLRVLPFMSRLQVEDWLGYERSRAAARDTYGDKQDAYMSALQTELVAKYGSLTARMDVRYTQYVYVGASAR